MFTCENLITDKNKLRNTIRSVIRSKSKDNLIVQSRAIISRLQSHPLFLSAKTILLFHSLPDEVDTHELIKNIQNDKIILLPSVVGDELVLHRYQSSDLTHVGDFGIIESDGITFEAYQDIDLAIIPGVAFDSKGHRLGRGRGYYDRFLPNLKCYTIGVCFSFQLVDAVPTEDFDKSVDEVLTYKQDE